MRRQDKKISDPNLNERVIQKGTVVHIALNQEYIGYILIADEIREEAAESITNLRNLGINNFTILSGDEKSIVSNVAQKLGITDYHHSLLLHFETKISFFLFEL